LSIQPNTKIGTRGRLSSALQALKYRNFKLFLGGQLVSLIGNYVQTIAQAWLVYRLTGSAALLGLVAFSGQISIFVLAPISGLVADSKSRKHILFATQVAPMLFSFLLAALTLTGRVRVWHVFAVAALMGVINAFDFPVRQAFVAELVPREHLISAVTLNSSMINSARTIGPGIGGLLVAAVNKRYQMASEVSRALVGALPTAASDRVRVPLRRRLRLMFYRSLVGLSVAGCLLFIAFAGGAAAVAYYVFSKPPRIEARRPLPVSLASMLRARRALLPGDGSRCSRISLPARKTRPCCCSRAAAPSWSHRTRCVRTRATACDETWISFCMAVWHIDW